jgi:CheY-like chemotaxis protein
LALDFTKNNKFDSVPNKSS